MPTLNEMVNDFLAQKRIAVVGISRTELTPANSVFQKLTKAGGYQVFPVNPNAQTIEGVPCYPDVKSIPGGVDAVFVSTRPNVTEQVVRQCAEAGVKRVWMHQSMASAGTSVSPEAVQFCRDKGMTVIAGGCPMMFFHPDFAHKAMRWVANLTGSLPKN